MMGAGNGNAKEATTMRQGTELIRDIDACSVGPGECAFWWLGQLGFALKLGRSVCWIDAYLAESPRRQVPPLVPPGEVTNAAMILGTHDHSDHIDRKSWPAMAAASPDAVFVVPELVRERVVEEVGLPSERVKGLNDGGSISVAGVKVTAVPAAHELLDRDSATGRFPYLGYVLEGNGFCLYHSGDTCIYEGIQEKLRQWKLDLAFLPINGRDAKRLAAKCIGNMTYQETVDLAGAVRPGLTVPGHWDMFAHNGEDPQLFADYMAVKYPGLKALVPTHGEKVVVKAAQAA
jgi:L-ascorbate metabolism protein UlaG (beta-lactamase superfamily)